jgi:peptidyl-prolyl cis-trans isomerase A (cyclophilin A)
MNKLLCFVFICLILVTTLLSAAGTDRSIVLLDTNHGDITIELYDTQAPVTVANFLDYVEADFYNGLIFHRVIDNFMVQAGAYDTDLYDVEDFSVGVFSTTDPNFYHQPNAPIALETSAGLKNLRGTIAMARTSAADSATSQFFINVVDNPSLDPGTSNDGYAVFGQVTQGMAVADEIAVVDTFDNDDIANITSFFEALPVEPVIINSATVLFLADPNEMADVEISLRAGNSRDDPSDGFTITGSFDAAADNFTDSDIFLRVGPWQETIDGTDLESHNGSVFTFNGSPYDGDGSLSLRFDTAHHRFHLVARNVNLTGLEEPIIVEIVAGDYYGQATAQIKGDKSASMKFLYGHSDAMRSDRYVYVYDDHHYSDSMAITGSIASLSGAINLKNAQVTITWATNDIYILPAGKFKQVGLSQKYVYRNPNSNLKYAAIDWKGAVFNIRMARSSISGPTKNLKIEIKNAADEVLFSKTASVP